jgi:hypothetical protein
MLYVGISTVRCCRRPRGGCGKSGYMYDVGDMCIAYSRGHL